MLTTIASTERPARLATRNFDFPRLRSSERAINELAADLPPYWDYGPFDAPIVYAADSAGFPYGAKSDAELANRVPDLLGRLVEAFHPRLAVIACNTASTIALDHARAALDFDPLSRTAFFGAAHAS